VVSLLPPLYLTYAYRGPTLWSWQGGWSWLAWGLSLAAVAAFVWSTRYYDLREFLGLRQLQRQESRVEDQERLRISPLHRHVRHPWYTLGLVLLWTRDMDPALLLSSVVASLYLLLGLRLEEGKLLTYHGDRYREYRKRVPALIPRPWRSLEPEEARRLSDPRGP
jgi:protein-S-isoprenylcysteine O-methyltransferase Ste14